MKDCLVVMDMQTGFMEGKLASDLEKTLEVQQQILADFRISGIPVFYFIIPGYGAILEKIAPQPEETVLEKDCSDAFYVLREGRKNQEIMDAMNPFKTIHMIGCNTDYCIKMTAESAARMRHKIVLYRNALLNLNSQDASNTLRILLCRPRIKVKDYEPRTSSLSRSLEFFH